MLSGLLITLDIFVCIGLVIVVLLQRSEGGAFGMGGGPTGLITARGAGDLLTRTTWVLFTLFIVLSLGLSLLGAHDRATSSLLEKLKLQQANPTVLSQPIPQPPPATTAPTAPAESTTGEAPTPGAASPSPLNAAPSMVKERHAKEEAGAPPVSIEESSPPPPPLVAPAPKSDETQPSAASTPSHSAPSTQP